LKREGSGSAIDSELKSAGLGRIEAIPLVGLVYRLFNGDGFSNGVSPTKFAQKLMGLKPFSL
jgi:hypothetical protein